ncbi:putative tail tubular protein [Pseudomonas phage MR16]|nr:putative scaffolding protein [Pseudomonas phage MR8]QJD55045.1 putative scaffolding protein [Pseudomonas phage MR12]QJF74612.1 putative tail tubular protein [Pseudomonas phage MR16]
MTLLEAVNLILRKIGEIPVTSVDEQYSTLTIALPALEEARVRILSEGYWFNTFYEHILQPLVSGEVVTPADCLKFFPADGKYAFTGKRISLSESGSIFVNEAVKGRLIIDSVFEELPEVVQYAIAYSAAYDTYVSDIGNDDIANNLGARRDEFMQQLNGDHTINRKQNSRQRKQVQRWRSALRT